MVCGGGVVVCGGVEQVGGWRERGSGVRGAENRCGHDRGEEDGGGRRRRKRIAFVSFPLLAVLPCVSVVFYPKSN